MLLHAATCCYMLLLKFSFKGTFTVSWFGPLSAVWAATMPSKGSFCTKSDALLIYYVKATLGGTFHEKQEVQNFSERRRRWHSFPESLPSWTAREWKQGVFLLLDLHTPAAQRVLAQKQKWGLHLRYSGGQSTKSKRRSCSYSRERPRTSSPQGSFRTRIFVISERPFSAVSTNFSIFSSQAPRSRRALEDLAQNSEENITFRRKIFGRKSKFSWFFIFFPLLHPIFFANFRRIF